MTKRMNEGMKMKAALEAAQKDTVVKEHYFITPASMNAISAGYYSNRSRSPRRTDHQY